MRLPSHLRTNVVRMFALRAFANEMCGRYGVPVFLVGSALQKEEPRDWDVRVRLSAHRFKQLYGNCDRWAAEGSTGQWTEVRWRWSEDCIKQAKWGAHRTKLNIDFQVYPPKLWETFSHLPRYRLDTRRRCTWRTK